MAPDAQPSGPAAGARAPWPASGAPLVVLVPATPDATATAPRDEVLLSPAERERAAAFRRPADRALYALAHAGLRRAVAPYVGVAPRELVLGAAPCPVCGGPHGRPLLPQAPGLHVSLSHTAGLAAVALATVPVGVDVEPRDRPAAELEPLEAQLHPDERASVAAAPDRRVALLRAWVRKEACLKGRGIGLTEPPDARSAAAPVDVEGWHVVDLDAGPGHVGALALLLPDGAAAPRIRTVGAAGDRGDRPGGPAGLP